MMQWQPPTADRRPPIETYQLTDNDGRIGAKFDTSPMMGPANYAFLASDSNCLRDFLPERGEGTHLWPSGSAFQTQPPVVGTLPTTAPKEEAAASVPLTALLDPMKWTEEVRDTECGPSLAQMRRCMWVWGWGWGASWSDLSQSAQTKQTKSNNSWPGRLVVRRHWLSARSCRPRAGPLQDGDTGLREGDIEMTPALSLYWRSGAICPTEGLVYGWRGCCTVVYRKCSLRAFLKFRFCEMSQFQEKAHEAVGEKGAGEQREAWRKTRGRGRPGKAERGHFAPPRPEHARVSTNPHSFPSSTIIF